MTARVTRLLLLALTGGVLLAVALVATGTTPASASPCTAPTATWTAAGSPTTGGGDPQQQDWFNADNWEPKSVPTAEDMVCIPDLGAGPRWPEVGYGEAVAAAVEADMFVDVRGGSLSLTAPSSFTIVSVTSTLSTTSTIDVANRMILSFGTLRGTGTITVRSFADPTWADLLISGFGQLSDSIHLVVEGDSGLDDAEALYLNGTSRLDLRSTFHLTGDSSFYGSADALVRIAPTGAMTRVSAGTTTLQAPLEVDGSVSVGSGSVAANTGSPAVSNGTFSATASGELKIGGLSGSAMVLGSGASLTGVTVNGSVDVASSVSSTDATLSGGQVTGTGTLTLGGTSTWSAYATLAGEATTVVPPGATLNVGMDAAAGGGQLTEQHRLLVNGTMNVGPGQLNSYGDNLVEVGGTVALTGNVSSHGGSRWHVLASGRLVADTGSDPLTSVLALENDGEVRARTGRWELASGIAADAVVPTSVGDFVASPGATLSMGSSSFATPEYVLGEGASLQRVTITGARFDVPAAVSATDLDLYGGALDVSGALTLHGTTTWRGSASLTGPGATTVPSGASIVVGDDPNAGGAQLMGSHRLVVAGTGAVGPGGLYAYDSARLHVDGTVTVAGALQGSAENAVHVGASGRLLGAAGPGPDPLSTYIALENDGEVRATTGRWELAAAYAPTPAGESNGTFTEAPGATLALVNSFYGQPVVLGSGAALDGISVDGADVSTDETVDAHDLSLVSGSLAGSGTFRTTGSLSWTGGGMAGTGVTVLPAGSTAVIAPADVNRVWVEQGREVVLAGTAELGAGRLSLDGGSVDVAGRLDLTGDGDINGYSGLLHVAGTLRKTAGVGTSDIDASLDNDGAVEARSGTLAVYGRMLNATSEGALVGGTWTADGGTLDLGNYLTTLAGTLVIDGPTSEVTGWGGPILTELTEIAPAGVLELRGGHDGTVPADLVNRGVLRIGVGSEFSVGGSYRQGGVATLGVDLSTGGHGTLAVADVAALDGVLALHRDPAYDPATGTELVPVTYASATGEFVALTGTAVGATKSFVHTLGPAALTLTVADNPLAVPAAVSALTSTSSFDSVTLRWDEPEQAVGAMVRYRKGAAPITSADQGRLAYLGDSGSATVRGLVPGSSYVFAVFSRDAHGTVSKPRGLARVGSVARVRLLQTSCRQVTLRGRLLRADTATPLARRQLALQARPKGATTWRSVDLLRTTSTGSYEVRRSTKPGTEYRLRWKGASSLLGTRSAVARGC